MSLALFWGAYGQPKPDSYGLYLAGLVLLVDCVGIGADKAWTRTAWTVRNCWWTLLY